MKLCIVSDIHANIFYLQKCLDYIKKLGVDRLICLGDVVGYFDRPNEVIDILLKENAKCLLGNHEAMMLGLIDYPEDKESVYNLKKNLEVINNSPYANR